MQLEVPLIQSLAFGLINLSNFGTLPAVNLHLARISELSGIRKRLEHEETNVAVHRVGARERLRILCGMQNKAGVT